MTFDINIRKAIPDWLIGILLTLFFLFITRAGILDFTSIVEKETYDLRARLAAPDERNPDIELVLISNDDLSEFGRYPWPRNILAQGIHNLSLAGARVIALYLSFTEPEESAGLRTLRSLKESFKGSGLAKEGPGPSFYQKLSQAVVNLDNDARLQNAMKEAGNVVLPVRFETRSSARDSEAPQFISRYALKRIKGLDDERAASSLIRLVRVRPLVPSFARVAAAIGHDNLFADDDGYIRNQVHVLGYLGESYFPSFPLAIVKVFKGLKDKDISVTLGQGIDLSVAPSSVLKVPATQPGMRTPLSWNKGPDICFHSTPFSKVYKNEIQTSLFRDKIVIIGLGAEGIADRYRTPISENMPGVEIVANAVSNILRQNFLSRPLWMSVLESGILVLFGLFISFALPKLHAGLGAILIIALLVLYALAGTVLFFFGKIWLKISPGLLLLVLGYILIISKQLFLSERAKEKVEVDHLRMDKMLGLSFQDEGMLDSALERFRKIPLQEEGTKELLYNLGLDFEKKGEFSKALATYELIMEDGHHFGDLDERVPRLRGEESVVRPGPGRLAHPEETEASPLYGGTNSTLGRYKLISELGRGAMGIVFKGMDPTTGRTVAIKTVRLSDFQEGLVEEIKERFFREAQSAGLLSHPNIVAIYGCGQEQDLAYIAMEFLEGEDLEGYVKRGNLLPLRESLSIALHVADALDYAHGQGIVHRDIKPANIMRLKGTKEIKVADFGIARITASSRTKTGIVLGTPSYMSPEQVEGKKVDGRSDIFSLGIVLFEMLTGQKPFRAQDMTVLMRRIAKEKHPSLRTINPTIPSVIELIIDKALQKDVERRYQTAGHMAEHLRKVVERIDEIQERQAPHPDNKP